MATNFPTSLDSLTNPSSGNTLNSPSHSTQHANANDAIEVLEAKVGVNNSAVTTSLDYKMRINNPVGEITLWGTSTAPTGWLICDGVPANRSTYSALHTLMQAAGYPYGAGDGSTTFGIPNLKGKVPVGRDSSDAVFDTLGETGGVKTNALVVGNLPAHTHDSPSSSSSSSSTSLTNASAVVVEGTGNALLLNGAQGLATYGPYSALPITASTSTTTTTTTTVSGGGNGTATGTAFDNLQPYVVLNYIIRF